MKAKSKRSLLIAVAILALILLTVASLILFRRPDYLVHKRTGYKQAPIFLGSIGTKLGPASLAFEAGRLYVSYANSNLIDVFSPQGDRVKSTKLPQGTQPRAIALGKERIFVADKSGEIKIFAGGGRLIRSYGRLPDGGGVIGAASMHFNGDRLYVADRNFPGVLVVSAVTVYGATDQGSRVTLTEEGELVLSIPVENPASAIVSPDGRVLVGATDPAKVRVFSCNGRPIGAFEADTGGGTESLAEPAAIAYDSLANPAYAKGTGSLDPSGIRQHGRVHVVDKAKNRVFVYATTGNFLFSYGRNELSSPGGIAVDTEHRLIFIADSGHYRIAVWGY